jgi:hypothetical protein
MQKILFNYNCFNKLDYLLLSVALQPGSGVGLPLRVFVTVRYVRCEIISPTINLILVILIRPPETSVSKASRHLVAKQMKHG